MSTGCVRDQSLLVCSYYSCSEAKTSSSKSCSSGGVLAAGRKGEGWNAQPELQPFLFLRVRSSSPSKRDLSKTQPAVSTTVTMASSGFAYTLEVFPRPPLP